MTKRKYLLFSAEDGIPPHLKPCAFFHSSEGCKNGSKCKFSHTAPQPTEQDVPPNPPMLSAPPTVAVNDQPKKAPKQASIQPRPAAPPTPTAPQVVAQVKQEPNSGSKKRKVNEEKTVQSIPVMMLAPDSSSSKPKKDKDRAETVKKSEIEELREQMRKQQELFEQKLASLTQSQAVAQVQHNVQAQPKQPVPYVPQTFLQPPQPPPKASHSQSQPQSLNQAASKGPAKAQTKPQTQPAPQLPRAHASLPTPTFQPPSSMQQPLAYPSFPLSVTVQPAVYQQQQPAALPPTEAHDTAESGDQSEGQSSPEKSKNPRKQRRRFMKPNLDYAAPPAQLPLPSIFSAHENTMGALPLPLGPPVSNPLLAQPEKTIDDSSDDDNFVFNVVNHVLQAPASPCDAFTSSTSLPVPVPESSEKSALKKRGNKVRALVEETSLFIPPDANHFKNLIEESIKLPPFDVSKVDLHTIDWKKLVQTTQSHHRFTEHYTFETDAEWVKARPAGAWCAGVAMPRVLAIDCEMCECKDLNTGLVDGNALIRLSVVNGLDPNQVFIDTLVAPSLPISDCRTRIHGIAEEQLQGVKVTLRHAQAALLNIITEDTILIGHSICNDLDAMKLDHKNVIDTAYLCPLEYEHHAFMGLRALIERLMGFKLPETHDSVQDAKGSLFVAAYVGIHGPPPNLIRFVEGPQLLLHRLPKGCTEDMLYDMLLAYTHVAPSRISTICFGRDKEVTADSHGKAYAIYPTPQHLDLAFESLPGAIKLDKLNRPQKRVFLKKKGPNNYISIRR